MLKVLLVSGPPASGKDTVVHTVAEGREVLHEKFANPLRAAMRGLLSLNDDGLEWLKRDDPRIREMMIGLSERLVKPIYGKDWFGLSCADRVQVQWARAGGNLNVVVSDAGFSYEVEAFCDRVREFDPDAEFELWVLVRPFCTYFNDSRSDPVLDQGYGLTRKVTNFGNLCEFEEKVEEMADEFFNGGN
jgi:hypothetical protein